MNIILLKPDKPAEVKVLESDKLSLNDMYKYCGCNMIDIRVVLCQDLVQVKMRFFSS